MGSVISNSCARHNMSFGAHFPVDEDPEHSTVCYEVSDESVFDPELKLFLWAKWAVSS